MSEKEIDMTIKLGVDYDPSGIERAEKAVKGLEERAHDIEKAYKKLRDEAQYDMPQPQGVKFQKPAGLELTKAEQEMRKAVKLTMAHYFTGDAKTVPDELIRRAKANEEGLSEEERNQRVYKEALRVYAKHVLRKKSKNWKKVLEELARLEGTVANEEALYKAISDKFNIEFIRKSLKKEGDRAIEAGLSGKELPEELEEEVPQYLQAEVQRLRLQLRHN